MLLGDLTDCIKLLQERIRSHRDTLRENETRTRMALIDPLLRALGWDVSDPEVVIPEYAAGGGRADYALLRADGRPSAILEAKKLGEVLDPHLMQMLNYANMSGIEFAGLTDGNHWKLYSVFRPGRLDDRRILDVSISDVPIHTSALKLMLLWRPNLESGTPEPASVPILRDDRSSPMPTEAEHSDSSRRPTPEWVALPEYNPPAGTPCPEAVRFWDGSEEPLGYWRDLLTGVVKKLHSEGRLAARHVPIGWGPNRYCVHTEAVHPDGTPFGTPARVDGTPFFVNVNLNAGQVRANTGRLLEHCDRSPSQVFLRPR